MKPGTVTHLCRYEYHRACLNIFCACPCHTTETETKIMGSTMNEVGVTFFVHDDRDAFPDDRKCLEDFQALLGAVLADPAYEDQVPDGGGYVDAYRAMMADPVARGRVAFLLIQALARVRKEPEVNGS